VTLRTLPGTAHAFNNNEAVPERRRYTDSKIAVRAALGLLDRSIKAAETMDVLLRLEALEAAAKQGNRNHAYQRPLA
jgi:hypothetical protein